MIDLLLILFLLVFSALFSGFESALFSLSLFDRSRLKQTGGISSLIAKSLDRPRETLSTILLGNEVVNVAISILAASIVYRFFSIEGTPRLSYLISVGVTTLIVLVFGEILPKNIAIRNSSFTAQVLIIPYKIFFWVVTPLRILFTRIIDVLVGLVGIEAAKQRRLIVEEEINTLLELGRKEGTLDDLERGLIQNVFDFSDCPIGKVMTPREKIVAIRDDLTVKEIFEKMETTPFSRFPVYHETLDRVLGIFLTKNLLPFRISDPDFSVQIKDLVIPFEVLSPTQTLDEALFSMRSKRLHMAIVKERGQVVGLITMDDLLRELF